MNRPTLETHIRLAQRNDAPLLCALAQATYAVAFGDTMRASDLQTHLEKNLAPENVAQFLRDDIVLVAETGKQLVGFVQFGAYASVPPTENAYELRRLYVLSAFQMQGIGTRLMNAALAHPQMQRAQTIYLDVWEYNHSARRLYERFGFRVVGKRKFQVASGAETDFDFVMMRDQTC